MFSNYTSDYSNLSTITVCPDAFLLACRQDEKGKISIIRTSFEQTPATYKKIQNYCLTIINNFRIEIDLLKKEILEIAFTCNMISELGSRRRLLKSSYTKIINFVDSDSGKLLLPHYDRVTFINHFARLKSIFYEKVLKDQDSYLPELEKNTGAYPEPSFYNSLLLLVKIKEKRLDLTDPIELKRKFFAFAYEKQKPDALSMQAFELLPTLKKQVQNLPIWFQNVFFEKVKYCCTIQEAVETARSQVQYFEGLLAAADNKELLLLFSRTIGIMQNSELASREYRTALLKLWELGERELVKEILFEKKGSILTNQYNKTYVNLMMANYLSEIPYKNIESHLKDIKKDILEIRQIADAVPAEFWKNWIDNWPGLFKLWKSERDLLILCANTCLSGNPFQGSDVGHKAKGDSLIYKKLFALSEDSIPLVKDSLKLFFLNPNLRNAIRYLLNEFDPAQIKQFKNYISWFKARLKRERRDEELSRNFRRLIYWAHLCPKLAFPLLGLNERYFLLIECVLVLHGNCIKITLPEIEKLFRNLKLTFLFTGLYQKPLPVRNQDSVVNKIYGDDTLLVPSINFLLSFQHQTHATDINSFLQSLTNQEAEIVDDLYKLDSESIISLINYYFQTSSLQVLKRLTAIFLFNSHLGKHTLEYICKNSEQCVQMLELFEKLGGTVFKDLFNQSPLFLQNFITHVRLPKSFLLKAYEWLFINPSLVLRWFGLAEYQKGKLVAKLNQNIVLVPPRLLAELKNDYELKGLSYEALTYSNVSYFVKLYSKFSIEDFKIILRVSRECPKFLETMFKATSLNKEYIYTSHITKNLIDALKILSDDSFSDHIKVICAIAFKLEQMCESIGYYLQYAYLLDYFIQIILSKDLVLAEKLSEFILDGYNYIVDEYLKRLNGKPHCFKEHWQQKALDLIFQIEFEENNFLESFLELVIQKKQSAVQLFHNAVKNNTIDKEWIGLAACYQSGYEKLFEYCLKLLSSQPGEWTRREISILQWLKKGHFAFASQIITKPIKFWEFYQPNRQILEMFFQFPEEILSSHKELKPLLFLLLKEQNYELLEQVLGSLHYLSDKDPQSYHKVILNLAQGELENAFRNSYAHPYIILDEAIEGIKSKDYSRTIDYERALETNFSIAAATCILSVNGSINSFAAKLILSYLTEKAPFPKESSHYRFLTAFITYLINNAGEYGSHLAKAREPQTLDNPIIPILRKLFDLIDDKPLSQYFIKLAILSAQMTRVRQDSNTESCFGTQTAIETQTNHCYWKNALYDYIHLIKNGSLTRHDKSVKPERTAVYKIVTCERNSTKVIDHPLSRAREYTIAQMCIEKIRHNLVNETYSLLAPMDKKDALTISTKLKELVDPLIEEEKREGVINFLLAKLRKMFSASVSIAYMPDRSWANRSPSGAWVLVNKNGNKPVVNPEDYGQLLCQMITDTLERLKAKTSNFELVETILTNLSMELSSGFLSSMLESRREFYGVIDPLKHYRSIGNMPWICFEGGYNEEVQAIYFERESNPVYFTFSASTPKELLRNVEKYIYFLPKRILRCIYKEPSFLLSMSFKEHSAMLSLHLWLLMYHQYGSIETPLLEEAKRERDRLLTKELKEDLIINLVKELSQLSEREITRLTARIKQKSKNIFSVSAICSLVEEVIRNYLGSAIELEAKIPTFENILCKILREAGFSVPKAIPLIDYNWLAEKHSNYYLGFRGSIWSGKIERYICFDGCPDIAISKDFSPELTEDNLWELPLFVNK